MRMCHRVFVQELLFQVKGFTAVDTRGSRWPRSRRPTVVRQRISGHRTHKQIGITFQCVRQTHGVNFQHALGEQHIHQQPLRIGLAVFQLRARRGAFGRVLLLLQDGRPHVTNRHADRVGAARGGRKGHHEGPDLRTVVVMHAQQVHAAKGTDNAGSREQTVNGAVAKGAVEGFTVP